MPLPRYGYGLEYNSESLAKQRAKRLKRLHGINFFGLKKSDDYVEGVYQGGDHQNILDDYFGIYAHPKDSFNAHDEKKVEDDEKLESEEAAAEEEAARQTMDLLRRNLRSYIEQQPLLALASGMDFPGVTERESEDSYFFLGIAGQTYAQENIYIVRDIYQLTNHKTVKNLVSGISYITSYAGNTLNVSYKDFQGIAKFEGGNNAAAYENIIQFFGTIYKSLKEILNNLNEVQRLRSNFLTKGSEWTNFLGGDGFAAYAFKPIYKNGKAVDYVLKLSRSLSEYSVNQYFKAEGREIYKRHPSLYTERGYRNDR